MPTSDESFKQRSLPSDVQLRCQPERQARKVAAVVVCSACCHVPVCMCSMRAQDVTKADLDIKLEEEQVFN